MPVIGVDTGGTFTDFYLITGDGKVSVYKRPSTPDDPARAVLEGLTELMSSSFFALPSSSLVDLVHGSTVATNAIIERKGARTALITTRGFRDVLVIGRQASSNVLRRPLLTRTWRLSWRHTCRTWKKGRVDMASSGCAS